MTDASDHELLQRIGAGDEVAFVTLYRRRQGNVYRFALRMCGAETVAEDVTQEVFLVLLREAARFDATRSQLTTWLLGIARNQVLKRLERERRWVALDTEDEDNDVAFEIDPHTALTQKLTVERVRQAVLALPPHYREAVVLCELHELSYAEAAEVLGCPIGTVRSRLNRGKALLSASLRAREAAALALSPTNPVLL
jgi:RNA polymerase sigma-70 factor (ECF subfamily)